MPSNTLRPTPQSVSIAGESYALLAFYYPGRNTLWDDIYNAGFLGNFWLAKVTLTPPDLPSGTFHTAEAAFQATKWWQDATTRRRFEQAPDGSSAFHIRNQAGPQTNSDWAGLGRVGAMEAVLQAKFSDPSLRAALSATGDAYLLEHNSHVRRDGFWSDNCDGTGENQLGLALMRLRSELNGGAPMPNYPYPGAFTTEIQGGQPCRGRP